ncbi:hypothetical protein WQE_13736 [Paraburkholderia hospita]|uniref:DNA-binding protein H-NS n=1 Tax=Paraburkholderia hospita TaxID=169430 RepID=A0ABN0FP60_9BURK|nr:H-NS family nucleoid-associated regulatory protein [Paraburkholderia hospita]EIN00478.1 hypothetical protein WQE_13736 [Paraburkholderia hospita]OUL68193.1 hypothetical protein CA602_51810 [Paraburkholderia hospita]
MKVKFVDEEARQRLIIWIRKRMDEFGITPDSLASSIRHDQENPPIYRDARGNEWNGLGEMPDWLRAAENAGVNPDFFSVKDVKGSPLEKVDDVDPRQLDLFN